jgi:choline dehydrogenase-like flavoprotein
MIHDFASISDNVRLDVDVVVVGSGAGGAVAAHRLARAGKTVALIEEGHYYRPQDFSRDSGAAMRQLYRDGGMRAMVGTMIIPTMQAKCVGGTTLVNSAICFRLPDEVLGAWVEQESLADLSPEILRPHFEEIEKDLNISVEDDQYLGQNNLLMRRACQALGWEGSAVRRNSRGCKGCGLCMTGCLEGAKLSMDRSYVSAFLELGGELYTDCRIEEIIVEQGRAVGVRGHLIAPDSYQTSLQLEVRAKAVIISCGAMGTPVLLQKNQLADSSGLVGKNLCNHTATGMLGFFEEEVNAWDGVSQGYCCDHFRKDGFIIESFWAPPDVIGIRAPGFGLYHKNLMARLKHMAGWGAMIRAASTGTVKAIGHGWNPLIRYSMSRRDANLMQKAMKAVADLLFAGGAKKVTPGIFGVPKELTDPSQTQLIAEANLKPTAFNPIGNHPLGTCRMSEIKGKGVVNSHGETHDVMNLFIADGSVFPNAPGVNPQVTIMALAAHFTDYIKTLI